MLCNNCGKPVEDGQELCPECLAAQEIPTEQEETSAQQDTPVQETAAAPKKKGGLIAILGGCAVAVIAAVILALNWMNWFSPPREYLLKVETDAFQSGYQQLQAVSEAEPKDMEHATTTLTVELSEEITDLLEQAMSQNGARLDLSWLHSFMLQTDANLNDDKSQMDIALGINSTKVVTVRVLEDAQNDMFYMGLPEMMDKYLAGKLDDVSWSINQLQTSIRVNSMDTQQICQLLQQLPDTKEMTALYSRYLQLLFADPETVTKSAETVTVNGITKKMTVLTFTVSATELKDSYIHILETAQNDEQLKQVFQSVCDYMNEVYPSGGAYSADEIWAEIPAELQRVKAAQPHVDGTLTYQVYVDGWGNVCGRKLAIPTEKTYLSYMLARDGGKYGLEVILGQEDGLQIVGGDNGESYSFSVTSDGKEQLLVDVLETEAAMVSFRIRPGKDSLEEIQTALRKSGITMTEEPSALLRYTDSGVEFSLNAGEKKIFTYRVQTVPNAGGDIAIPTDTLDAETATEEQLKQLLKTMDFEPVYEKMAAAGVPEEYVAAAREYITLLIAQATAKQYYEIEDFASIVIDESTAYDVFEIAPNGLTYVTGDGGVVEYPMEDGQYIRIKFYGAELVVGGIEVAEQSLDEMAGQGAN